MGWTGRTRSWRGGMRGPELPRAKHPRLTPSAVVRLVFLMPMRLRPHPARSKAFAMMSLKEEDAHSDLTGVPDDHLQILDDW